MGFIKLSTKLESASVEVTVDSNPDNDVIAISIDTKSASAEIDNMIDAYNQQMVMIKHLEFISNFFDKFGITNEGMAILNANGELAEALQLAIPALEDDNGEPLDVNVAASVVLDVVQESIGEKIASLKEKAKAAVSKIGGFFSNFYEKWLKETTVLKKNLEAIKKTKFESGAELDEEKWLNLEMSTWDLTGLKNITFACKDCLHAIAGTTKIETIKEDDLKTFDLPNLNQYLKWMGKEIVAAKVDETGNEKYSIEIIPFKPPSYYPATLKQHQYSIDGVKGIIHDMIESISIAADGKKIQQFILSTLEHNEKAMLSASPEGQKLLPTINNNIKITAEVAKLCMNSIIETTKEYVKIVNKLK